MIDKRVLQLVVKEESSVDIFQLLWPHCKFGRGQLGSKLCSNRRLSRCRFPPLPIMKDFRIYRFVGNTYLEMLLSWFGKKILNFAKIIFEGICACHAQANERRFIPQALTFRSA
jgi:hypothetical protein